MPCASVPALQEVGTVKAKAIPTEVMEKIILAAQLELQYAKSSLFTCPASRSAGVSEDSGVSSSSAAFNSLRRKRLPWEITATSYSFEPSSTQWNSPKIGKQWLTPVNALNWQTAAPQGACWDLQAEAAAPRSRMGNQEISTAPGTHTSSSCSPAEEMSREQSSPLFHFPWSTTHLFLEEANFSQVNRASGTAP